MVLGSILASAQSAVIHRGRIVNHDDRKRSPVALVFVLTIVIIGTFAVLVSGLLATLLDPDLEGLAALMLMPHDAFERP